MTTPAPTLPDTLGYGTVRWLVTGFAEDSGDPGSEPDAEPINGIVIFRPIVEPAIKYIGTPADPEPITILPRPQQYTVTNGVLKDSSGNDVRLVACDSPATSPQDWQYEVSYQLDDGYTFGTFRFSLHTDEVVYLTLKQPEEAVDGTVYVTGPQGPAGRLVVGTVTTLAPGAAATVVNDGTPEEAVLHFGIPEGMPGEVTQAELDAYGTSNPTPGAVVRRDAGGGAGFVWVESSDVTAWNAPTQPYHLTRKDYVDALGTSASNPDTVARRGVNSELRGYGVYSDKGAGPEWPDELTRKDYVDTAVTGAKARANHTGTQPSSTLSDLTETVQDIVGAFLVAGTGVTVSYDDVANTFTINATGGAGGTTDPEIVRDVIGTAMVAGAGVQITVNDAGDTITIASTAVLPTRQVISGTGLTGGGDLSADRTLAVTYGTAAGTAAQGNDTRITGAAAKTAVEGLMVHDGSAGGGARPAGFFRVRWVGGATRPTNMAAGDVWEHDA